MYSFARLFQNIHSVLWPCLTFRTMMVSYGEEALASGRASTEIQLNLFYLYLTYCKKTAVQSTGNVLLCVINIMHSDKPNHNKKSLSKISISYCSMLL
jgi:hypothetical protein